MFILNKENNEFEDQLRKELYNAELKIDFLKQYSKNTQIDYARIFKASAKLEKKYKKDLYDFNIEQIEDLMMSLMPSTMNASVKNKSVISSYLFFTEEMREGAINDIVTRTNEWTEKFVMKGRKLFRFDEIEQIENSLFNIADKMIVRGIFEGIGGYRLSELRSLKIGNIDVDNGIVKVYDEKTKKYREINVSDRLIQYALVSHRTEEYYSNNGVPNKNGNIRVQELKESKEFVLKARRRDSGSPFLTYPSITIMFNKLSEWMPHTDFKSVLYKLKPKTLTYSGINYMIYLYVMENHTLDINQEFKEVIANKFGYDNHDSLWQRVFNEDEFLELYPEVKDIIN